jgi:ubiquinone/menaquinone biosynthesis C-methylase UbiE
VRGAWLDGGCNDGGYTAGLCQYGASSAVGTDIQMQPLHTARRRCVDSRHTSFAVAAGEAMPFATGSFDGILLNEVLEHVQDEGQTLAEMHRLLRPGGHLVVFSPNRWFPFEGHGMLGPIRMPYPVPLAPWLPVALTGRWMQARNYWPRELRQRVVDAGFMVAHVGFAWPLFNQYRWLPTPLVRLYSRLLPWIERVPIVRRFGVSTMIIARRSPAAPG